MLDCKKYLILFSKSQHISVFYGLQYWIANSSGVVRTCKTPNSNISRLISLNVSSNNPAMEYFFISFM